METWTDYAMQACTKFGLTAGEVYTVTCMELVEHRNQVMLTLPGKLSTHTVSMT